VVSGIRLVIRLVIGIGLGNLVAGLMRLVRSGEAPLWARKLRYFADPEFRGMFDAATQGPVSPTQALPLNGPRAT
jgi:hypothetical protein